MGADMPAAHEAPLWQLPMLARAPETGGTRHPGLEREAPSHYAASRRPRSIVRRTSACVKIERAGVRGSMPGV